MPVEQTLHSQTMPPRKGSASAMAGAKTKVAAAMAGGRIKVASARARPKPQMEGEQLHPWNVSEDSVNAEHFIVVQKAIEKIEACPVMEGIRNAPPIARGAIDPITGKAGYKGVFTQERLKEDLLAAGISEQAGNLFYQNSFLVPL